MGSDRFDIRNVSWNTEGRSGDDSLSAVPVHAEEFTDEIGPELSDLNKRLDSLLLYRAELEYMAGPGQMLSKPNLIRGARIWVRSMILVAVANPLLDAAIGKSYPALASLINLVVLIIAIILSQKAAAQRARKNYDFRLQSGAWWSIHWRHTVYLLLFGFIYFVILGILIGLFVPDADSLVGELYLFYLSLVYIGWITLSLALLGYAASCAMLIGIRREIEALQTGIAALSSDKAP